MDGNSNAPAAEQSQGAATQRRRSTKNYKQTPALSIFEARRLTHADGLTGAVASVPATDIAYTFPTMAEDGVMPTLYRNMDRNRALPSIDENASVNDTEGPPVKSCRAAIEQLFKHLPDPAEDDGYCDYDVQDTRYRKALEYFMEDKFHPDEHTAECDRLGSAITEILEHDTPDGLRVAFIEGISWLFLDEEVPEKDSAEAQYLDHCRWIFKGRKDREYCPGWETRSDCSEGNEEYLDISHLPNELTTPTLCALCERPGAKVRCDICELLTDSRVTVGTAYCSPVCQLLHWTPHSRLCSPRRQFMRSVNLTNNIFVTLEHTKTTLSLESTEVRDGMLLLTEKSRIPEALRGGHTARPVEYDSSIPAEHFEAAIKEEIHPGLPWMIVTDGILLLWSEIVQLVEECTVIVRNAHLPIVQITASEGIKSNMLRPHTVFRITLNSGEVFALDYAAGRFGWKEMIVPWDLYEEQRVLYVVQSGYPDVYIEDCKTTTPHYEPIKMKCQIHRKVLGHLAAVGGLPLSPSLLKEDMDVYAGKELAILNTLQALCLDPALWVVESADIDFIPCTEFRLFLDHNLDVLSEYRKDDRDLLEELWLEDDAAAQVANTDWENIQAVWEGRLAALGVSFRVPRPSFVEMLEGASVFY